MMKNIYSIIAAVSLFASSVGGAYLIGRSDGKNIEKGRQLEIERIVEETRRLAMRAAADEIAKITVTNTTIQGEIRREIIEKPVYRDCAHDADVMQIINAALRNTGIERTGDGKLPRTDTTERQ